MPESKTIPDRIQNAATRKIRAMLCLAIALLCFGVYWPVARSSFVNFDDPDYVTMNPQVQAGLTSESIGWAFSAVCSSNWHPVTWLSHMLDCQLYGLKPAGHHLTNVGLHSLNSALLFLLLSRMTRRLWASAFVAALFAVHPLHVESVAWVSERKDVLCALFFFLTIAAYLGYVDRQGRSGWKVWLCYGLALALFALGLMSKPMLVTLPFVLLLLDVWPLKRLLLMPPAKNLTSDKSMSATSEPDPAPGLATPAIQPRVATFTSCLVEKLPFFLLSAGSCYVTFLAQRFSGAMVSLANNSLDSRLASVPLAYGWYLAKTIVPTRLAALYPYHPMDLFSWQVLAAAALVAGVTAIVLARMKDRLWLFTGWFWFLGMLVPVIGLVQVGKQAWADRYLYLPQIGLGIIVAWGAIEARARLRLSAAALTAAALAAITACAVLASRQTSHWKDTMSLFRRSLDVTTDNFVAHTVIAEELSKLAKYDEAIEHCNLALRISPRYPEAYNTLGNIYTRQTKYDDAIAAYRKAIECDPTFGSPYHGIANAYLQQSKYPEAEALSREALKRAPMHVPAMYCLAVALHNQHKLDEAIDCYRRLEHLEPTLFSVHRFLGNALVENHQPAQAIPCYQTALRIRPADTDTRNALGVALLQAGRPQDAEKTFREVVNLQPTNALANLQLAQLCQGRKDSRDAVKYYRLALASNPELPEALNNLAWLLAADPDASIRNGEEAVARATRACELTSYNEPLLIGTLAAACAEAGKFPEAIKAAAQARDLALKAGQKEVAERNSKLLELYRSNHPFHDDP